MGQGADRDGRRWPGEESSHGEEKRDRDERCQADAISFTRWEGKIGRQQRLLFSSARDGNQTIEQALVHGNLKVHD